MHNLLMLAGGVGLLTATAALCLHGRRVDRRFFAGLISIAVTLSLFSVFAWVAPAIARVVPLPLTWALICTLALIFALILYRELQAPPSSEQG
jgi:presenilin-like A22 family membrane protease